MKAFLLLLTAFMFLFAPATQAALPEAIRVSDSDSDGDLADDINAAMTTCGEGWGTNLGGCTLIMDRGKYRLDAKIDADKINGVTLRGQGTCFPYSVSGTNYLTNGTCLTYNGAAGGVAIEWRYGMISEMSNFTLDMADAGVGIDLIGGNGYTNQMWKLDTIVLVGDNSSGQVAIRQRHDLGSSGYGLGAQVDKGLAERVWTRNVDIGVEWNSLQAIHNVFAYSQIQGNTHAFKIKGGAFDLYHSLIASDSPDHCTIDLEDANADSTFKMLYDNIYVETGDAKGLFCNNSTATLYHPIELRSSYINNQCPGTAQTPCTYLLFDGKFGTSILFNDNHFVSFGSAEPYRTLQIKGEGVGSRAKVLFNSGNTRWSTSYGWAAPGLTGTYLFQKIEYDDTANAAYNDLNMNWTKDSGE